MSYRNHNNNNQANNSHNRYINSNANDQYLNIPGAGSGASIYDQQGAGVTTTTIGGSKPKTLHIAHRRSPSELTSLMIEQFNLQRQLELVQAQQQLILQQQSGSQQYHSSQLSQSQSQLQPPSISTPSFHNRNNSSFGASGAFGHFQMPSVQLPPPSSNQAGFQPGHQKRGSGMESPVAGHRRSLSNTPLLPPFKPQLMPASPSQNQALGHSRRHSLGLSEAKKLAAIVQSQRSSNSPSKLKDDSSDDFGVSMPPPSFKFPATPPASNGSDTSSSQIRRQPSHGRSRSMMTYSQASSAGSSSDKSPQRNFQFPPRAPGGASEMLPPAPQFQSHPARGQSGNWRRPSPSNSNPNMNNSYQLDALTPPSSTFVPGHRLGRSSFGGSISSLSNYGGGSHQGGAGGSQRKSLFAPYLPQSSLPALIAEGRLVTGTLRVNKKNRSDAYVSTDGLLDADVFICGSKDRNRALEGDLVAVELLVVDEVWSSKREKEEKKRRKDHSQPLKPNDDLHNDASTTYSGDSGKSSLNLSRKGSLKQRPTQKKNDDVEVEGQSLLLVEEEEISDDYKPLYAGHVVAVVDRIPGQLFSGTLGLLRPSQASKERDDDLHNSNNSHHQQKKPKIVWFKPTDKKVPLIAIPTEQAPKDFVENHEKYAGQLFVSSIKRWPITSLHPFGTLILQLGPMEEASTEIDAILRDNNFLCDEYPLKDTDKLFADLPVLEDAFNDPNRKVFHSEYIISASQTGAISDHAFHVKSLSSTKIEVGVHIADITYGVKQGSLLDKKAKKRSHSVFLPQRTTHLFPERINEMFSFKENEQNLAISVIFAIDTAKFEIDDVWIGESVVVPKQKISYDAIDRILTSSASAEQSIEGISNATTDYIRTLSLISREFRRQRLGDHNLETQPQLPLFDQLDDERVKLTLNVLDSSPSMLLIDEIFHKVNFSVAQKIFSTLGDRALLRRHALPTLQKMETYLKKVSELGIELDDSTSASLQKSILKIEDANTRKAAETLLIKCMNRAKYTIAGKTDPEQFGHYLFNLPLYTHFTAPLRRYADVIVHRQLKAVLHDKVDEYLDDVESLKMTADYCNFKKDCAKAAQEQAMHLLLSQSINDMAHSTGQLLCLGTVLQVYESSFDVLIPEIGIEKRVHGDQLPLTKAEFDKRNRVLELYWEKGVDSATYVPEDENDALSYRASIKNKHRSPTLEVAKLQKKSLLEGENIVSEELLLKLTQLNIAPPRISLPTLESSASSATGSESTFSAPATPNDINTHFQRHPLDQGTRTHSSSIINSSSSFTSPSSSESEDSGIVNAYLKNCNTRIENDHCIQEIRVLQQVPILLRAEIGMALPCLTVRALNPFVNTK